jgi:hypothetical protein
MKENDSVELIRTTVTNEDATAAATAAAAAAADDDDDDDEEEEEEEEEEKEEEDDDDDADVLNADHSLSLNTDESKSHGIRRRSSDARSELR